ncbi:MAG: toprim domain-containing protein, partial [Chitinophagaceae bacterium]
MEIPEIKQKLTLPILLHHYGLKADKQNRLKCPFHNDKTPSLQLYYKTQTDYCFSTNCQTHGKAIDVIDFIMYYEKLTKHEAIIKAGQIINPATQTLPVNNLRQDQSSAIERTMFLERMFTYFKNAIHNSKPAREYIQSRCLDFKKTEVGYNGGQFHHGQRKDGNLIRQCLEYGLLLDIGLKSRTGDAAYKPFGKWSICFALRNRQHEITGLYFRSTLNDKEQRHFYLRNRQGLYPGYPKAETKQLILTESIIDAATLLEQEAIKTGYEILSLYGTNGLTEEHQKAIKQLQQLKEVIFFLDGDEAGNKAIAKYAPMFKAEYPNLKITNVTVPQNEDINSLLQGHSSEILTHLIDTRKDFDFFISNEEAPQGTESKILSDENKKLEAVQEPESIMGLNTSNPYSLKYQGREALYQIKGFRTEQMDSLKITLQAQLITLKLDLYEYKQVESTCKIISEKLSLRKDAIEADLLQLTSLLEQYRHKQQYQARDKQQSKIQVPAATISQCITFLKEKGLIKRINEIIGKAGKTGEETNRILLFVIASSYKMVDTLHGLIQGSSGSGKTRLLKV